MARTGETYPGAAAFRLLFYRTDDEGRPRPPDSPFLRHVEALLRADSPDAAAFQFNALARFGDAETFAVRLLGAMFDSCVDHHVLPGDYTGGTLTPDAEFLLRRAAAVIAALRGVVARSDLPETVILPRAGELFSALPEETAPEALGKRLAHSDPFAVEHVFTFRAEKFTPVRPASVKPVDKFFGFPGVRAALEEHFRAFADGTANLPLLVNSLPGYGKTSMIVSFALARPGVTVILPDPGALEHDWNRLVSALESRTDHRFVLFFDDIDPRQVDWYSFRTNVGGAFTPPSNIMPVLAANYEFPPSILSRGRKISYPVFDEERCSEMIEDFLKSFGMKHPPRNIVSLMGARYTEEFGQKKFTELSPRTLMRFLAVFERDARKRSEIVDLAAGQVITRPDGELFYEFNIELMRSLYGEEYIQRLLKERLREL